MLKMRIIPCLDVKDGEVVKGVRFQDHESIGDIIDLAKKYCKDGADELVFYDITASSDNRTVDRDWVRKVADVINIPFCVAGGIRTIEDAASILESGADKISINSPALERPSLIDELAGRFGSQCIVIGIDSCENSGGYHVYQYTGDISKATNTCRATLDWAKEVVARGAGEIVLNCMNQDGVRSGYDIHQTKLLVDNVDVPVVASGGAGEKEHFMDLFQQTNATGALAASVFHKKLIEILDLKIFLDENNIEVRL